MSTRDRLSASVDAGLLAVAKRAVARGESPTLSAWVDDALRLKIEHEKRLQALAAVISAFEAEQGEITGAEIERASHRVRGRAIPVRRRRRSA